MSILTTPTGQLKGAIVDSLTTRPMTLAELGAATQTSLPTVRRALQDLLDNGWVRPFGQTASTGGRPATLFSLDTTNRLIIGVHVEIPTVNMVAVEFGGGLIDSRHISARGALLPDDAVRAIADYVVHIRADYPTHEILGIGMAAPGYVDPASGDILYVGRAEGWQNFPLRTRLEEALGLPIIMENDTDCLIRMELDSTDLPIDRDTVYLAVLEGVKLSMLLNGHIYRGPFGNAGLIGRTSVGVAASGDGRPGGNRDLEEVASVGGVCAGFDRLVARASDGAGPDPVAAEIAALTNRNHKFEAILLAAAEGHPLCQTVADDMIVALSGAVANMLYILQPMALIAGGQLAKLPAAYRTQFERRIRDRLPTLLSNRLTIHYATITGRYAAAHGATHWFLRRHVAAGTAFALAPAR